MGRGHQKTHRRLAILRDDRVADDLQGDLSVISKNHDGGTRLWPQGWVAETGRPQELAGQPW